MCPPSHPSTSTKTQTQPPKHALTATPHTQNSDTDNLEQESLWEQLRQLFYREPSIDAAYTAITHTKGNEPNPKWHLSGLEGLAQALFLTELGQRHTKKKPIFIILTENSASAETLYQDILTVLSRVPSLHAALTVLHYPFLEPTHEDSLQAYEQTLFHRRRRVELLLQGTTPDEPTDPQAKHSAPPQTLMIIADEKGASSVPTSIVGSRRPRKSPHNNPDARTKRTDTPLLADTSLFLELRKNYALSTIIEQLQDWGYTRENEALQAGEFARRGDVLDLFTPQKLSPSHLIFFGDELESITSLGPKQVLPEQVFTEDSPPAAPAQTTEKTIRIFPYKHLPHGKQKTASSPAIKNKKSAPELVPTLSLHDLSTHNGQTTLTLKLVPIRKKEAPQHLHIDTLPSQKFNANLELTKKNLARLREQNISLFIVTKHLLLNESLKRLLDHDNQELSDATKLHTKTKAPLHFLTSELSSGFSGKTLCVLSAEEIFGKRRTQRVRKENTPPETFWQTFIELEENDYVVHLHHGIGMYRGIKRISMDDREKDYFRIDYQDDARIFVPVEQLHLLQKYIGDRKNVRINKLSKTLWRKTKDRAKRLAEAMAKKLIALYSKRQAIKVSPIPREDYFQRQFELQFPHEENPDQLKCSEEILADLEQETPMDRLLCADVGYGKTEVMMRAVFKVAFSGRQCLVVVPTTLLSLQHYETFLERFKETPIRIALLNRFTKPQETKTIFANIHSGHIEVLIATHRALTKKLKFKKLSLFVIDEEQKFGVAQKEVMRLAYPAVHTLSLSATPIPRTLHLSLAALRDLSFISTPIPGRRSVVTHVSAFDVSLVQHAVARERERGGQCYFIYNRVKTLASFKESLQAWVKDASILSLHGQLDSAIIEKGFSDFHDGKYDILLATSIIDAGIDLPRANTLFVYHSHRMGLAQLYQLKGRVGRSTAQAYAYFFYPQEITPPPSARERLHCLMRYQDLGSGYQIAVRDMELRGAGNLLGIQQSGTLALIGLEMFSSLLRQAITKIKTGASSLPVHYQPLIELSYKGFIPDAYTSTHAIKAGLYRKIMTAASQRALKALRDDLQSKYGSIDPAMENLFIISDLRIFARRARIFSITEQYPRIAMSFLQEATISQSRLLHALAKHQISLREHSHETHVTPPPEAQPQTANTPADTDADADTMFEDPKQHPTVVLIELSPYEEEKKRVPLPKKISLIKDCINDLTTTQKD